MREVLTDVDGALLTLEVDPASDLDAHEAKVAGLVLRREVLQLRRPLPIERSSALRCRSFQPGADDDEFLRVNNLAFAWHPDQSNWTREQLTQRIELPWFSPEGFLVHEHDHRMLAFCWTKVHPATGEDPELGEIYVIGVDPAAHGRGLGTEIVLAGLEHLSSLGITTGMLHVEADNHAALQMYDRLGFTRHSSHQWWARPEAQDGTTATEPGTNP